MGHATDPWGIGQPSAAADLRVKAALTELGLSFEVDDDCDFRVRFVFPTGRKQECTVESRTWEEDGLEIREAYSVALRSEGPLDTRTATQLLLLNGEMPDGCWTGVREPRSDIHLAILRTHIPAFWNRDKLLFTLDMIARGADAVEERFSGRVPRLPRHPQ